MNTLPCVSRLYSKKPKKPKTVFPDVLALFPADPQRKPQKSHLQPEKAQFARQLLTDAQRQRARNKC
jgi:hypothetical protein